MTDPSENDPTAASDVPQAFAEETVSRAGPAPHGAADETIDLEAVACGADADATVDLSRSNRSSNPQSVRRIGDYELIEEIARGGMGIVYKARQLRLNRIVALKMILAGQFAGPEEIQRFLVEAQAAAGLDHPGIVPIYEIGSLDGNHYYSMGFVDGPSLGRRIAESPFSPHKAAELSIAIAEAVGYAHERGIVHRDLKPSNVLLDGRETPRVTDFGLAKRLQGGSDLTHSGQILGTPSYMPPEQAAGRLDEVGPRSDVYSLGAILYCLLVGRPPFASANPIDTLTQVLNQDPVPPRKLDPSIPQDLQTICLKCLHKSPTNRYSSAKELSADLRRFLDGEPIHARPLGAFARSNRWLKRRPVGIGCAVMALGIFLMAASAGGAALAIASFSTAGFNVIEDRENPVAKMALERLEDGMTEAVAVEKGGMHELEIWTTIRTPVYEEHRQAHEALQSIDENGLDVLDAASVEPKFEFVVRYELFEENGAPIVSGVERVVSNASGWRFQTVRGIDRQLDEAVVEKQAPIVRFAGPERGRIKARIEIEPDDRFGSRLESTEVVVFENVRNNRTALTVGGAFCVASPMLLAIGALLALLGPTLTAVYSRIR